MAAKILKRRNYCRDHDDSSDSYCRPSSSHPDDVEASELDYLCCSGHGGQIIGPQTVCSAEGGHDLDDEVRPTSQVELVTEQATQEAEDEVDMAVSRAVAEDMTDMASFKVHSKHKQSHHHPSSLTKKTAKYGEQRYRPSNPYHNKHGVKKAEAPPASQIGYSHDQNHLKDIQNKEPSQEPNTLQVTYLDILGNIVAILSYFFDVGSDIWLAYNYYSTQNWWWFGLTLGFVVVPALTMTLFSMIWYIQDHSSAKAQGRTSVSPLRWASRFIFLFFQIAPALRYIDATIFAIRHRQAIKNNKQIQQHKHWYHCMLNEDTDSTLLRLFECFMEAAPQLVLQLYIISVTGLQTPWYMGAAQVTSCVTSLLSLSWGMAAYHKALRLASDDKAKMTWTGVAFQFAWRLFTIGARILTLALFASQVHGWIFAVTVSIHYLIMLVWVLIQRTDFCESRLQEILFNIVLSAVYIFTYLNAVEGHTRLRYIIYYAIIYSENMAMAIVWYSLKSTDNGWYIHPSMVMVFLGFFIGCLLQIIFYKWFHPNNYEPWARDKAIKNCLTWSECLNRHPQQSFPLDNEADIEVKTSNLKDEGSNLHRSSGERENTNRSEQGSHLVDEHEESQQASRFGLSGACMAAPDRGRDQMLLNKADHQGLPLTAHTKTKRPASHPTAANGTSESSKALRSSVMHETFV